MVWIQVDTAHQMARLHGFGRLIGSSEMHAGNLGVLLTDTGPRVLAPAYDMLPVSLAPSNTGALRAAAVLQLSAPECGGGKCRLSARQPKRRSASGRTRPRAR